MKFKIILEPSEDGGYAVHVPLLKGCHTQGDTIEEALENARDSITTYLETVEEIARESQHIYEIEVVV
jgi:predicted RNase H-like HicB family nuclease